MKFGQLIEYNRRNIFLEKSYTKSDRETIPDPSLKNQRIEHISGSIAWSFIQFVFIVYKVGDHRNIMKLSCKPLAFTSYKDFLKNKKQPGTSLAASFLVLFLKKNISLIIFH